jgi:hypothetical protein
MSETEAVRPRPARDDYVGTIVGESTSREFRLAVARETIREQDIVAVDAELRPTEGDGAPEEIRIWAKVQRIERLNPLFPVESGHELAETRTNPFDTVLSLSREMVTAVCQVLGWEPVEGTSRGRLAHLRYPPQPASQAYRPQVADVGRVVLGALDPASRRAVDLAWLSNRDSVDVFVDGHAIVSRHLAILAMTGAGKSVTARRIVEQLAAKRYPIVIFDPHGDYTGLADLESLRGQVRRFYAQLPVFEEETENVIRIVESLAWPLTDNQRHQFDALFRAATTFRNVGGGAEESERRDWLANYLGDEQIRVFGLAPTLYYLANFIQAVVQAARNEDHEALDQIRQWSGRDFSHWNRQMAGWIEGVVSRVRRAAASIRRMEQINRRIAGQAEPLPTERTQLVRHGQVSIVSLAGYTGDFQATIYTLVASAIFEAKVRNVLRYPVLLALEEAHNFVPGRANTGAEERSIAITKQIAQEGRKFNVGLVLISQRPSRLDETALSMCNSYIIMRMINPADQNFVRKVVESLGEDDARLLPDLDVGEAILSGQLVNFPVLVKIKPSAAQGEREETDSFELLRRVHEEIEAQPQQQQRRGR